MPGSPQRQEGRVLTAQRAELLLVRGRASPVAKVSRCPGNEGHWICVTRCSSWPPPSPARPLAPCPFRMWEAACSQHSSEGPP